MGCIYGFLFGWLPERDSSLRFKGVGRCGIALRLDFELGHGASQGTL